MNNAFVLSTIHDYLNFVQFNFNRLPILCIAYLIAHVCFIQSVKSFYIETRMLKYKIHVIWSLSIKL